MLATHGTQHHNPWALRDMRSASDDVRESTTDRQGRAVAMSSTRQNDRSAIRWHRWGYTAAMPAAPVVAIINTSEDIVAFLRELLAADGFRPVTGFVPDFREGRQDLDAFLQEHDPAVIIWDIGFPYDRNWAYFQEVRGSDAARGRRFVLTTTNKRALEELVGPTPAHELIGKPYDIEALLGAVHRAVGTAAP